jgi:hypothetical protein
LDTQIVESFLHPPPSTLSRNAGFPSPLVPRWLGFGNFMRPSGVGVADPPPESHPGPLRSPAPGQPDPALPGGRGEDGARRQQPLPGTRRQPHSRTAFGANSSRRRSTAGVGGTPRRAQGQAQPCLGWRGPGAGCNAQGLPPRDPGLSGTRWVLRSGTGLSPRSAPFSRPGWAGLHHRDITSIQDVYRAPAALQVRAIHLHSNKARPALPPRTHLQVRLSRTFRLGREIRVSGQAGEWVVAVYCHAPARGRARTHAHSLSGLGFLSGKWFGVQPSTPPGQTVPPRISQCARARRQAWSYLGASVGGGHSAFVTFVLALS